MRNDWLYNRWNTIIINGNIVDKIDCMFAIKNPDCQNERIQIIHYLMLHGY